MGSTYLPVPPSLRRKGEFDARLPSPRRRGVGGEVYQPGIAGVITNSSASVISNNLYDVFGVKRYEQGSAQTPWRFRGLAGGTESCSPSQQRSASSSKQKGMGITLTRLARHLLLPVRPVSVGTHQHPHQHDGQSTIHNEQYPRAEYIQQVVRRVRITGRGVFHHNRSDHREGVNR